MAQFRKQPLHVSRPCCSQVELTDEQLPARDLLQRVVAPELRRSGNSLKPCESRAFSRVELRAPSSLMSRVHRGEVTFLETPQPILELYTEAIEIHRDRVVLANGKESLHELSLIVAFGQCGPRRVGNERVGV